MSMSIVPHKQCLSVSFFSLFWFPLRLPLISPVCIMLLPWWNSSHPTTSLPPPPCPHPQQCKQPRIELDGSEILVRQCGTVLLITVWLKTCQLLIPRQTWFWRVLRRLWLFLWPGLCVPSLPQPAVPFHSQRCQCAKLCPGGHKHPLPPTKASDWCNCGGKWICVELSLTLFCPPPISCFVALSLSLCFLA